VTILILALAFLLIHVLAPWGLSKLSTRHGWVNRRPGRRNLLTLFIVIPGIAATIGMITSHYRASPDTFLEFQQSRKLLTPGPYAFSRNPMYLMELGFWFGWALFYGSLPVLIGFLIWFILFNFVIIPYEEHDLERRFGEVYRQYKQVVPRWLGKIRS
jgi:protein-S-isoprenylcysteine O-methyltransferase Ste14